MKCKEIRNIIVKFIHDEVGKTGRMNVVIGLSGGLDSSVVAKLAVDALGKDRVIGILMPNNTTEIDSIGFVPINSHLKNMNNNFNDAKNLAESLDIEYLIMPLTSIISHEYKTYRIEKPAVPMSLARLRAGNIKARARMIILYDQAMERNAIVLGTTNKTELMLGYFTKYGDGGVDIEPIADLYKTEVFKLAKYIGIPENIIKKAPSADLWPGQTDEEELGLKYKEIDQILWWLIEEDYDAVALDLELEKLTGLTDKTIINKVLTLLDNNYHKRHMPSVCKIGNIDIRTTMANNGKNGNAKRKY